MDPRRLELLLMLSRLGSMREVADELALSTSTVSQQIAALAKEVGMQLVEPVGRRVRLTPAGRRLAGHAVTILAAIEAATNDLDPAGEPIGTVRACGFETGLRRTLIPAVAEMGGSHPEVRIELAEAEVAEAIDALLHDRVDLALVYDYDLAPLTLAEGFTAMPLWSNRWGLAVPSTGAPRRSRSAPELLARYADTPWIVNSRHTADEEATRVVAAMAGFAPRVRHRVDDLDLVADLVALGFGVALLPLDRTFRSGVRVLPLDEPSVVFRAYVAHRRGADTWAPLRVVLDVLGRSAPRA